MFQMNASNKQCILVVDDDSPDGTSVVVNKALDRLPRVRLITRKTDKGLVNSIKEGINKSAGDVCVWMDADLSMPAGKIRDLLEKIEGGDDLAVGCRYIDGGGIKGSNPGSQKTSLTKIWKNLKESEDSIFAVAVSKYGNLFARFVLDSRYHDYTSGFYAVKKSVFDDIKLEGEYPDYCISFLYKASLRGYRISETPVTFTPRKRGKSKTANNILSIFLSIFLRHNTF